VARGTLSASRSGSARRPFVTAAVLVVGNTFVLLALGTVVTLRREAIVSIVLARRGIRAFSGLKHSANSVMVS
jgi:hypothetical protein